MKLDRKKIVPHLQQKSQLILCEIPGKVYSAVEFAKKFSYLLEKNELLVLEKQVKHLNEAVPKIFSFPVANIDNPKSSMRKIITKRVGSRSAFYEKTKIKLKGCRIPQEKLCFPHESLDFGKTKMETEEIPFGVLTAENAIREILAFCFMKEFGINPMQKPLAVFEYEENKKVIGYCLLSHSFSEKRLESQENFCDLKIKDLIFISELEKRLDIKILNNPQSFHTIKNTWYAKEKSSLLIKMNFNGGFRGILNSNLGNDIEYKNKFYICDFDTFKVIDIPKKPTKKFVQNFVLWCVVEMLKTSPFVFHFENTDSLTKKQATEKIWNVYIEKSLLWKNYHKKFINKTTKLGWDKKIIDDSIKLTIKTNVFCDLIFDNILTSEIIKNTYDPKLSFYTKQG